MNLRAWDPDYVTREMSLYDHVKFGDDRPNGLGVHKEHTDRQTDVSRILYRSKGVNVMGLRVNEKQNFVEKSIFTD